MAASSELVGKSSPFNALESNNAATADLPPGWIRGESKSHAGEGEAQCGSQRNIFHIELCAQCFTMIQLANSRSGSSPHFLQATNPRYVDSWPYFAVLPTSVTTGNPFESNFDQAQGLCLAFFLEARKHFALVRGS